MTKEIALKIMEFISLGSGYTAVALAAIGSSIGTGYAGAAAIGAWKNAISRANLLPSF